jgi:hypothetical protein
LESQNIAKLESQNIAKLKSKNTVQSQQNNHTKKNDKKYINLYKQKKNTEGKKPSQLRDISTYSKIVFDANDLRKKNTVFKYQSDRDIHPMIPISIMTTSLGPLEVICKIEDFFVPLIFESYTPIALTFFIQVTMVGAGGAGGGGGDGGGGGGGSGGHYINYELTIPGPSSYIATSFLVRCGLPGLSSDPNTSGGDGTETAIYKFAVPPSIDPYIRVGGGGGGQWFGRGGAGASNRTNADKNIAGLGLGGAFDGQKDPWGTGKGTISKGTGFVVAGPSGGSKGESGGNYLVQQGGGLGVSGTENGGGGGASCFTGGGVGGVGSPGLPPIGFGAGGGGGASGFIGGSGGPGRVQIRTWAHKLPTP